MKKVALGIDIGGTGTKYGFVDKEGKIFKTNMRGAYLDAALEQLIP